MLTPFKHGDDPSAIAGKGLQSRAQGVALVLVLSFLVVISGLIIAFFSMVTTEASSAGTTAAASSAKNLADSAVNFVMGTIVEATAGHDPTDNTHGGPQYAWAWASQPGMIRTFDNVGKLRYVYKLYSADVMKLADNLPSTSDTAGLANWAHSGNREVWVDMNEPIKDAQGNDVYPIVDPRAWENYDSTGYPGHEESTQTGVNQHKVAGFSIDKKDGNMPAYDANNNNPAPMPVKWLYVLQNGKLATATQSGQNATINGTDITSDNPVKGRIAFWTDDECSKVNINTASEGTYWDVPRVYSYADGGEYVTRTNSGGPPVPAPGRSGLAITQPAKGEFQRYPGHPAMTSLSQIFGYKGLRGNLSPVLPVPVPANGYLNTANDATLIERYYTLTPRLLPGGSSAGTKVASTTLPATASNGTVASVVQGGYWRLYSSVDELLFDAIDPNSSRSSGGGPSGNGDSIHRVPNVLNTTGTGGSTSSGSARSFITPDMMQKAKFFITANSSGPELTQFNTPRVSMWPINDTSKVSWYSKVPFKNTPFDELAKFCATVGPLPKNGTQLQPATNIYYFTRYDSRSNSNDYAGRNPTLYAYLQKMTSVAIPGALGGSNFADKYRISGPTGSGASDRDQILTCIYDYIRCVNMQDSMADPTVGDQSELNPAAHPYRYTPISVVNGNIASVPVRGAGEVIPIRIPVSPGSSTSTQGFGRYDTIASAYLLFFSAHAYVYGPNGQGTTDSFFIPDPAGKDTILESAYDGGAPDKSAGPTDAMGVVFMLSFNNVMQGNVGNHPKTAFSVSGLDQLTFTAGPFVPVATNTDQQQQTTFTGSIGGGCIGGPTVFPPGEHVTFIENGDVRTWHGRGIGGTVSPVIAFTNGLWGATDPGQQTKKLTSNTSSGAANYPFFGYTNQLPRQDANKTQNEKNLYYPQTFKITQGQPIIVKIAPAEVVTGNVIPPGSEVQTFQFNFPTAILHMPWTLPVAYDPNTVTSPYPIGDKIRYNKAGVPFYFNWRIPAAGGGQQTNGASGSAARYTLGTDSFVMVGDTIVSLEPAGINNTGATFVSDHTAGDHRMHAALQNVPSSYFQPNVFYGAATDGKFENPNAPQMAHNMMRSVGSAPPVPTGGYGLVYHGVKAVGGPGANQINLGKYINTTNMYSRFPDAPRRVYSDTKAGTQPYVARTDGGQASWDTGMAMHKDGAYINKPDEGDSNYVRGDNGEYRVPYVYKEDYFANAATFFSPNREIPSSMMLGSIPSGIQRHQPWQTLLFHPPGLSDQGHPGSAIAPADHYIADLFWMPTVEPYAISQPFSTAGKINMNYQIQPFTYIKRKTAMRALMASTRMAALRNTLSVYYKPEFGENPDNPRLSDVRYPIDLDATSTMLDYRFDSGHDLYRSATEISTIPLIPKDASLGLLGTEDYNALASKMDTYWGLGSSATPAHQLTGNNLRDKPYADLYGRLTTKSNAFTVHVRAQALRKANSTPYNVWTPGKDQVIAEYRGSAIIERYIDANDPLLPDFASLIAAGGTGSNLNMDQYYKFRVVSTKRFTP